jgi:preprotein translocase subunit SecG
MQAVVLTIHLLVCVALIGLVLLQRSEGGALGMGGGGSGALMSGRGAADALARMTQIAGFAFLITSLLLTVLSGSASSQGRSVLDLIPRQERTAPLPAPTPAPVTPARPDPTQSSAPEAAQSQLALAAPGPAAATPQVVPTAGAHAAPLQAAPSPTTAAPLSTNRAVATPASATQRSSATTTQTSARRPPAQPAPQGAAALSNDQSATESADAPTGPQPVRRERAGPDQ